MIYALIDRASRIPADQANIQVTHLLQDISAKKIVSLGDLVNAVSSIYNNYFNDLATPLTVNPLFVGLPISDDWNEYQRSVIGDLDVLFTQVHQLAPAVAQELAFTQLESELGFSAIDQITTALPTPTRYVFHGLETWTVNEAFITTANLDSHATKDIAYLPGYIELSRSALASLNMGASITIDDSYLTNVASSGVSNGFVGNTHEVAVSTITSATTGSGQNVITFVSNGNLHTNIKSVLNNNNSTWFEYEVCNIPDAVKVTPCQGLGFTLGVDQGAKSSVTQLPWYTFHQNSGTPIATYPPLPTTSKKSVTNTGIDSNGNYVGGVNPNLGTSPQASASTPQALLTSSSAPEVGGHLTLDLRVTFPAPEIVTHITITPHPIAGLNPTISELSVVDSVTGLQVYGNQVPGTYTFTFSAVSTALIRITLNQSHSYKTLIGHLTWLANTQAALNSAPGGEYLPVVPNGKINRVDGPTPLYSRIVAGAKTVISTIDTSNVPTGASGPYIEAFAGWRYAIGLRAINIQQALYLTTGVYTSNNIAVPVVIQRARLTVQEELPDSTTSIDYEISFDNGSTWYPIAPISRPATGVPSAYVLSDSLTLKGTQIPIINSRHVRLRATLASSLNGNLSPRLFSYKILLEGTA